MEEKRFREFLDFGKKHFKCTECGNKVRGYATDFSKNTRGFCNVCWGRVKAAKVVSMPYKIAVGIKLIRF